LKGRFAVAFLVVVFAAGFPAGGQQDRIQSLIQKLEQADTERNRTSEAQELGNIGPEAKAALAALTKAQQDPSETVRREAAIALKRIQQKGAYPKISAGVHYLEISDLVRTDEWMMHRPTKPDDVIMVVHLKTDITDEQLFAGCVLRGTLGDGARQSWNPTFSGYGKNAAGVIILFHRGFVVPNNASAFEWQCTGYPAVDLGF
jgi:hypothetical protein